MSISTADKLKRDISEMETPSNLAGKDVTALRQNVLDDARGAIREAIVKKLSDEFGTDVSKDYLHYSNLYQIAEHGVKESMR